MYTLTHGSKANSSSALSVGGFTIPAGGSVTVPYLDAYMIDAIQNNMVSATPSLPSLIDVTDNTGGTIPSGYTVDSFSASYSQSELNDFAALVLDRLQALNSEVDNLRARYGGKDQDDQYSMS